MDSLDGQQLPVDTAILVVLMACMHYDGHVAEAETRKLRSLMLWSPIFASNTPEEDDQLLATAANILGGLELNRAVDLAVASLPGPLKTTALCFAFDVVYADGHIDDAEKEFLLVLAKKMQMPASVVESIDLVTVARYANG